MVRGNTDKLSGCLSQEDLLTPSMQRRSADGQQTREPSHQRSKSLPASTPGTPTALKIDDAVEDAKTPMSPSDSNIEEVRTRSICTLLCSNNPQLYRGVTKSARTSVSQNIRHPQDVTAPMSQVQY